MVCFSILSRFPPVLFSLLCSLIFFLFPFLHSSLSFLSYGGSSDLALQDLHIRKFPLTLASLRGVFLTLASLGVSQSHFRPPLTGAAFTLVIPVGPEQMVSLPRCRPRSRLEPSQPTGALGTLERKAPVGPAGVPEGVSPTRSLGQAPVTAPGRRAANACFSSRPALGMGTEGIAGHELVPPTAAEAKPRVTMSECSRQGLPPGQSGRAACSPAPGTCRRGWPGAPESGCPAGSG